jgi:peptidyl-tRNA hydrolase, PTH2 family
MPVERNPFDDPKLVQARAEQDDPIVQYYIVRKDVPMSTGKVCAQIAHAAQIFFQAYIKEKQSMGIPQGGKPLIHTQITEKWMAGSFRKVVLAGKKKDFEKVKTELDVFAVRDAGLTEVEPGTETVLVTWPIKKSQQPKVLAKLQVLKKLLSPEEYQTCQKNQVGDLSLFSRASTRVLGLRGRSRKLLTFPRLSSLTSLLKRPRNSSIRT